MRRSLFVALAVLMVAPPALLVCGCSATNTNTSTKPEAAIIDQLYNLQPNEAFIQQVSEVLEAYGFIVDLYQGDEVTVELYRRLPAYGYKLIVFRSHSGLLGKEEEVIPRTCVFTNELYSETRHVTEQLTDQLAMARIDKNHPWVFAIGAKFVSESMERQFPNTAIIMMGCSGLYVEDLAKAYVQKGASIYIAWDVSVGLDYVDSATIALIEKLLSRGVNIGEAVRETMEEIGPDPYFGAALRYYPSGSGNRTIKELTR